MNNKKKIWIWMLPFLLLLGVICFFSPKQNEVIEINIGEKKQVIKSFNAKGDDYLVLPNALLSDELLTEVRDDVKVISGGDVPSLFVNTSTGSMKEIYNDKKHKESCSLMLIDPDGTIDSEINLLSIKGRGNSTWDEDKKPFSLCMEEACSFLGMSASDSWILLANAMDKTNIRNQLVFDIAKKACMEWTPEGNYVNLYLNGEYAGLYYLVQSVDTFVETKSDLVLATSELEERKSQIKGKPIKLSEVSVEVSNYDSLSDMDLDIIEAWLKKTDEIITVEKPEDLSLYIDMRSWATKYLIDEIFENLDSGMTSSYFYFTYINDTFSTISAGPIWDYDNCIASRKEFCGTTFNPEIIYAGQKERCASKKIMWYQSLLENEIFYDTVKEEYLNFFLPVITEAINSDIDTIWNNISQSVFCDSIRWGLEYEDIENEISDVKLWLGKRIDFLNDYWITGTEYVCCTLKKGDGNQDYYRLYIKKGGVLGDSEYFSDTFNENLSFYRDKDGKEYDFDTPVNQDITLYTDKYNSLYESIMTKIKYNYGLLIGLFLSGVVVLCSIYLLIIDVKENKGTR